MIIWLSATALAATSPSADRAVSSVGATAVVSHAVPAAAVDVLVGERLDIAIVETWRVRFDGRFTFQPIDDPVLQWMRLCAAGATYRSGGLTLDLGRSPVAGGGPRLVDGVQATIGPVGDWRLGAWAGLAPDLFTTLPRLRYGGGPTVQWSHGHDQASLTGEVLFVPEGLDRVGALLLLRHEQSATLDLSGRLDAQVADPTGRPSIADAAVRADWNPTRQFDADLLLESYSSLRYLQTADLDPYVDRYVRRSEELGVSSGISEDLLDPSQYTLAGVDARWRGKTGTDAQPMVAASVRGRMHERPEERALRAGPRAGMLGLAEGHVDVVADAMVTLTTEETVGDAGVTVTWEPPDRAWALDASVRGILSTAGSGWYADTFIDVFGAGRWSLVAGLFAEGNFDVTFQEQGESSFYDQAEGGFLRASVDLAR